MDLDKEIKIIIEEMVIQNSRLQAISKILTKSNLPGLTRAESNALILLVAAKTIRYPPLSLAESGSEPVVISRPSISTNNVAKSLSEDEFPPEEPSSCLKNIEIFMT